MIANEMRVAAGQLWVLPSEGMADPIQLRVMEVADDGYAAVQTVRRSAPDVALDRSTMHVREVMDTGVLVDGPDALDSRVRQERAKHLSDLLVYAARQSGSRTPKNEFRFDGHEAVQLVARDEGVPMPEARAMLRDALATIGGAEVTNPYDPSEVTYVVPGAVVDRGQDAL